MKKIITSLLLASVILFTSSMVNAQTAHPWELGFNAGASWYKSDIKMKKLGGAGGFTFGQMYCMNKTDALFWGWRFRYLNATAYGQDYKKSFGIKNNFALNGTNDSATNYYSNGGYVYQNYKSIANETSIEIVIGLNQLRARSNVLLYVFGGAGLTKVVTKTDQLDGNNKRYNYSLIDSAGTGSQTDITSRLNDMRDGNYETTAEGSRSPQWKFMPSFGIGLGYQFTPGFSMGFEHKITWALNDVIDGQQWDNSNAPTGTNDMYHYSSVWLKFSFGQGHKTTGTTTTTTNTTNANNFTTASGERPSVVITNPGSGSMNVSQNNFAYTARVDHVNSQNDITVIYNGISNSNFTYDAYSHSLTFPVILTSGSNTFMITATNASGSTSVNAPPVVYTTPVVSALPPPVISFFNPNQNPYTTDQGGISLTGIVQNISYKNQMQITVNGIATNNFSYTPGAETFTLNTPLVRGANVFVVSAGNPSGSDSKSTTVIYQQDASSFSVPAPLITITGPTLNPYTSVMSLVNVTATILNVSSPGQISVKQNGVSTNAFTFNPASAQLSYNANLIEGVNSITISATNPSGSDSKPVTIIYNKPGVIPPPLITLISPASNPYTSPVNYTEVVANIQHVTSFGEINVMINGAPLSPLSFNFNPTSGELIFNANLVNGANTIVIAATNAAGANSLSETIIHEEGASLPKPVVSITSPSSNPFNTVSHTATIDAAVLHVTAASQIMVIVNGTATTAFSFNPVTHQLSFNSNLIVGANTISVTATNPSGSDSRSITIVYTEQVTLKPFVTITSPADPFNTGINTATIDAMVLNVTAKPDIMVTVNGASTTAFGFNAATHQLTLNTYLAAGANTISITGTNSSGSDSKTITVNYAPPVLLPKPVVSITSPVSHPFNTTTSTVAITATVLNVTAKPQIVVTENGTSTTAFGFNAATHQLTFNANLLIGSNSVSITATNTSGSDEKTITVIYSAPPPVLAPVVSILNPPGGTATTDAATYNFVGMVLNVSSAAEISLKLNGAAISGFIYEATTKRVLFTANLVKGPNAIILSASNSGGSDSKTATVSYFVTAYTPPLDPQNPSNLTTPVNHTTGTTTGTTTLGGTSAGAPQISVIMPASTPFTTTGASMTVMAKITGIAGASDVVVKVNGSALSTVSYVAKTQLINVPVNLILGNNTIVITATNASGAKTQTVTVIRH